MVVPLTFSGENTMHPLCKISWIDDKGNPTPDENESIGYCYCEAYSYRGDTALGGKISIPRSENFPICQEHEKYIRGFSMRHWHFVAWPSEKTCNEK